MSESNPRSSKDGQGAGTPRISVVIPAYNHERFVGAAVESVLAQTMPDWELIVIDDGSVDGTPGILAAFEDPRIDVEVQENIGAAPTINKGIAKARGEYVCILNSDDTFSPTRLETLARTLDDDSDLDAVVTYLDFVDDDGAVIRNYRGPAELYREKTPPPSFAESQELVLHLLGGNFICTTSNLFCRRSVFDRWPAFKDLRYLHDYEFFLRLCYHGRVRIVPEALVQYRIHAQNTIKENEANTDYELALVLAEFLLTHDLSHLWVGGDPGAITSDLFDALNARSAKQLLLSLLVLGHQGSVSTDFLVSEMQARESDLRAHCTKKLAANIEDWKSAQDAWSKWRDLNEQLLAKDSTLAETLKEKQALFDEQQELWTKLNASNDRIARADADWQQAQERVAELDRQLQQAIDEKRELWEQTQANRAKAESYWQDGQKAWSEVESLNVRVTELDTRLGEQLEKEKTLWQDCEQARRELADSRDSLERVERDKVALERSASLRIGRVLTWPWRVFTRSSD